MSIALEMIAPIADRARLRLSLVVATAIVCAVVSARTLHVKMDAISEFPLPICAADASSLWQGDHWADNVRLWHKADPTEPPKNVRFRTCARPLSQKQRSPPTFRWLDLSDCAVSLPKLPSNCFVGWARA